MPRNWLKAELDRREDRVDRTEFAMALFSVRGHRDRSEQIAADMRDDPEDWREKARRARR
ncbi:MAG: hypothetical protein ABEJ68_08985 [Halobacteriaceae archaeon]